MFVGTKGVNGIDGVIAIDDVALSDGQCLREYPRYFFPQGLTPCSKRGTSRLSPSGS